MMRWLADRLCRHGWHSWVFVRSNEAGPGYYERCRRCGRKALVVLALEGWRLRRWIDLGESGK
jgi:hypothetical protein